MVARHTCFGLRINSDAPIPGLPHAPAAHSPNLRIWLRSVPSYVPELLRGRRRAFYQSPHLCDGNVPALMVWELAGGTYFQIRYAMGPEFIVSCAGTDLVILWEGRTTVENAVAYLLGPAFAFVLRLRGLTPLHASAVAINGQAIALLGPPGAGKSTTAASFLAYGARVISDDVVALIERDDHFQIPAAAPQLRLRADSVGGLFGSADFLPELAPGWNKRRLDLTEEGCLGSEESADLSAIYMLDARSTSDSAPSIEAVASSDALIKLAANTYMNYLLDKSMRANEFRLLGRLVNRVPVRRVTANADFARLPGLCEAILADVTELDG